MSIDELRPPFGTRLICVPDEGGRHEATVAGHQGLYVDLSDGTRFHLIDDLLGSRDTKPPSWGLRNPLLVIRYPQEDE